MSDQTPMPRPRRRLWWRIAAVLALLVAALWLLLVSARPSVERTGPPTAQTVEAARTAIGQIDKRRAQVTRVRFTNRDLEGLATLAGDAAGIRRIDARIDGDTFTAAASVPAPVGGWINAAVAFSGEHEGFPKLQLSVGRIELTGWASRAAAELARRLLRWQGARLPPLDEMVRHVAVDRDVLTAELLLPRRSGIVRSVAGLQGVRVDGAAVGEIYCRLVAIDREQPDDRLAVHVRRAFGAAPKTEPETYNLAAFVALAWLTVGDDRVADLAPGSAKRVRACGRPDEPILLNGREDLAKHWAFSAALVGVLGTDATRALGRWKELDDSLPQGSGFSFVDLAADRSGVYAAQQALDPATSAAWARRLASATEQQLLPLALLTAREGLSEQQFLARYGTVASGDYQATVASIDRALARQGSR